MVVPPAQGVLQSLTLRQSEVVPCTCLGGPERHTCARRGPDTAQVSGGAHGPEALHTSLRVSWHLREVRAKRMSRQLLRTASTREHSGVPGTGLTLPMSAGFVTTSWDGRAISSPFPAQPQERAKPSPGPWRFSGAVPGVQPRPQHEKTCQRNAGHFPSLPSGQVTPGHKGWWEKQPLHTHIHETSDFLQGNHAD